MITTNVANTIGTTTSRVAAMTVALAAGRPSVSAMAEAVISSMNEHATATTTLYREMVFLTTYQPLSRLASIGSPAK